ncbi:MAG: hypothetical protein K2Q45_00395 [Nitrosomonas sp.]|nr:hypothetical protein [Nitrosomonas sp.]
MKDKNSKKQKRQTLLIFFWFTIFTTALVLIAVLPPTLGGGGRDRNSFVFVGNVPNLQNGLNTSVQVVAGDVLSFFTYGTWFICNNVTSPQCISNASGVPGTDTFGNAIIPFVPLGTLIGNVSNCLFVIAYNTTVTAPPCNGTLILLMNDNDYSDNFPRNLTVNFNVRHGSGGSSSSSSTTISPTSPPVITDKCLTQPRPLVTPTCNPLLNDAFQESPFLSFEAAPLRFQYDPNFRRYIYMYQLLSDLAIKVVSPTWEYTIDLGFNPLYSYLTLDCTGNVYVIVSVFENATLQPQFTLTKIDTSGAFAWNVTLEHYRTSNPIIIGDSLIVSLWGLAFNSFVKFNISDNGSVTYLPAGPDCSNAFLAGAKDRFFVHNLCTKSIDQFIYSYDLDGNFIGQAADRMGARTHYSNATDGSVYFVGYTRDPAKKKRAIASLPPVIRKYDESLNLIFQVNLTDNNAWNMVYMGNRMFVKDGKIYYISSNGYPYGMTYLAIYSDVDGSFISSSTHAFSVDVSDISLSFDSLANTVYFYGLSYPDGINPTPVAINTFCI